MAENKKSVISHTEKQIETYILSLSNEQLGCHDLYLYNNRFSQVNLGAYGIADIVCFNTEDENTLFIQVVEIKKEKIDIKTLLQASRYANGLKKIISEINREIRTDIDIVLIGESIDHNSDFLHLVSFFDDNVSLYEYSITPADTIEFYIRSGQKRVNNLNRYVSNHIIKTIIDFVK